MKMPLEITKQTILDMVLLDNIEKLNYTPEIRQQLLVAMDKYAKEHASLAFDAGYNLAAMHETNLPDDALSKEDYLKKHFPL